MYNNYSQYYRPNMGNRPPRPNRPSRPPYPGGNQNDDRFGFLGPFVLGGITGGLVAPFFYGGYNRPYYYPPYYYGPYPRYY